MTKFKSNEKKEAGRQRKLAAEDARKLQKAMQKEEELSREWGKGARDTSRADAKEEKRLERMSKKCEKKQLEVAENAELEKYGKGGSTRQCKEDRSARGADGLEGPAEETKADEFAAS